MSAFSSGAKETMLDALTADRARLHSGDPGAAGTNNSVGTLTACTFAAASGGTRALSTACEFTGLDASQSVTWFSVWDNNGGTPIFLGSGEITSGDVAANAAGEFTLTTDTELQLNDPV